MNNGQRELLVKRLADHKELNRSITTVVQKALQHHKDMGNSIAVWRDGHVVIVPPEEIVLLEDIQPETETKEPPNYYRSTISARLRPEET